ncbi:MAG: diguanylate cyclase, partial [Burkholderiales bacterium]|nr:diguanylate cyclase [Burkholderiales bacterium]
RHMAMMEPGPTTLANAEILDAFMAFPAPLAFLGKDGHPELLNDVFRERFGEADLDAEVLHALALESGTEPRSARLTPVAPAASVRTVRTPHRIMLIVDTDDGRTGNTELETLHARITELERLSATDHLTGAWNRAHLDAVIAAELARSQTNRQPLSLVLFDIDHFKQVNDTFGHAAGDSVLCELVRLVRGRTRASDLLFRWGGEEFVVLVASAGYRHAGIVAEKLRLEVAGQVFDAAGPVTISLGVAEHDGSETAQSWFGRLDAALYEAKDSGRNRVVVSRRGSSDAWAAGGGASALHLIWMEGYECGEPVIDAEHRELFRLANALIDAAVQKPAAVAGELDALLEHVRLHFADEEAILARMGYAHLEEHQRAHAGLLRRAAMLQDEVRSGKARLGAVVEFLAQDVVARHMIAVDRAFFPLFSGPPGSAGLADG